MGFTSSDFDFEHFAYARNLANGCCVRTQAKKVHLARPRQARFESLQRHLVQRTTVT